MSHTMRVVAAAKRIRGKGWHVPTEDTFEENDGQLAALLGSSAAAELLGDGPVGDQPSDDDGRWVGGWVVVWVGGLPSRCANQGVVVALATLPLVQRGICSLAICTYVLLLCARCGFAHCMSHD
jgi:hypothetical protein